MRVDDMMPLKVGAVLSADVPVVKVATTAPAPAHGVVAQVRRDLVEDLVLGAGAELRGRLEQDQDASRARRRRDRDRRPDRGAAHGPQDQLLERRGVAGVDAEVLDHDLGVERHAGGAVARQHRVPGQERRGRAGGRRRDRRRQERGEREQGEVTHAGRLPCPARRNQCQGEAYPSSAGRAVRRGVGQVGLLDLADVEFPGACQHLVDGLVEVGARRLLARLGRGKKRSGFTRATTIGLR